jgi:hypothetical protein
MSSRALQSDVVVIGYGSLMSGLGLRSLGAMRVRAASRLALLNARRGFGKFSRHGDHFTMVLEPLDAAKPLEASALAADSPVETGVEAIGLLLQPRDLAKLCDREGYSAGALQRLQEEGQRNGRDLATFLWCLLEEHAFDTRAFRQHLFRLVGYTSPHYIPHPVRVDGARFALTFLAPGREGTGSDRVVAVRVETRSEAAMSVCEAWQRKPNPSQLGYFVACLLSGVHGVSLTDLLEPLSQDFALASRLRLALRPEQSQELARFLGATGLDHQTYWQTFGAPNIALRRSGLDQFMREEP